MCSLSSPAHGTIITPQFHHHRSTWSAADDLKLTKLVQKLGTQRWSEVAAHFGGQRAGKQCRERWCNQLDPTIKCTRWSQAEEHALIDAHQRHGNRWSDIARELEGRPENAIKNHVRGGGCVHINIVVPFHTPRPPLLQWNATLRRKDPVDSDDITPLKRYMRHELNMGWGTRMGSSSRVLLNTRTPGTLVFVCVPRTLQHVEMLIAAGTELIHQGSGSSAMYSNAWPIDAATVLRARMTRGALEQAMIEGIGGLAGIQGVMVVVWWDEEQEARGVWMLCVVGRGGQQQRGEEQHQRVCEMVHSVLGFF